MTRFVIEREIPGAKDLTQEQLADIARTSNDAAASLGVPYTWVTSYVAGDKIYCVHDAEDAETILEHARRGGFPANKVTAATTVEPTRARRTARELTTHPPCADRTRRRRG